MSAELGVKKWRAFMKSHDAEELSDLLADDVVFYSPVVHTPQVGKDITLLYLSSAGKVLGDDKFQYVREVIDADSAVLEFTNEIDGVQINGIDMIRFNDDGRIVEFKVMIRPLKAINIVHKKMGEMLQKLAQQ